MPWHDPAVIKQKTEEAQDWVAALHLFKKFQHDAKVHSITRQSWRDFPPTVDYPDNPVQHPVDPQDYQSACENQQQAAAEDQRNQGRQWIDILNHEREFIERTFQIPDEAFQERSWEMHQYEYIKYKDEMVDFGGVQVNLWHYAEQYVENVLKVNNWDIDEEPTAQKAFAYTDYKTPDGHELPGRPGEAQSNPCSPASSTPAGSGLMGPPTEAPQSIESTSAGSTPAGRELMGPPSRPRSRFTTPDGRDLLGSTTETQSNPPASGDDERRPTKAQKRG